MTLNQEQQLLLKEVTDFIIEFEEKDYEDWVEREGRTDGHVYWKAKQLAYAMHGQGITWMITNDENKM